MLLVHIMAIGQRERQLGVYSYQWMPKVRSASRLGAELEGRWDSRGRHMGGSGTSHVQHMAGSNERSVAPAVSVEQTNT